MDPVIKVRPVPSSSLEDLDLAERSADHTTDVTTTTAQVLEPNKNRTEALLIKCRRRQL